ncbi:MAG: ABC transporter ATP-binding protein/permease [Rickettsiaceae bacterium]|nr:ABC transporter ATP-binding protein/permease [Rickettsiaceae bacterium]MDP4832410.1 ABC transporter ATP-binding protein/permease [Rickettsiaceae bacterium]MDP5020139.1 ABC transporter ATP-binding protein/permease [Rickettsiaceae bacterium]MDP5082763.1 ABC transporter ATP-binding protein/permease [Rickettsiaceae bacterium]
MSLERKLASKLVIKRLLQEHVAPYKGKVIIAILFMVLSALCAAAIVWLVQPAIDRVFMTHDREMLILIPLAILAAHTIKGIAEYFQSYIIKYIGQQILTNMQMRMYEHLLSADFLFLQSQSSGRLISRFTNDIVLMRGAVSNMLVGCAKHFLSVLFLIIIMFSLEPFLSAFVFFAFPFAIYPIQKLGRRMRAVTGDAQEELSHFTSRLDETFFSIKIIKSFCTEKIEAARAKKITDTILEFYKKAAKFDSLTSPIMEILSGIAVACVLWYGGFSVIEGNMTTGALFAFITAFVSAYRPFKSLVALNVNLQEGLAAANRVFNILDLKPTIHNIQNPTKPKWLHPEIEFKQVGLKFDNNKTGIESLNIKIPSGQTFAIVGRSGSGKTTAANLLVRFFDPTTGEINIDGENIKNISLQHLRSQIAMVTQDTLLFDSTISENIAYGTKKASQSEIIEAAKAADAHEFINSLPQGYETIIGVFGSTLSGGQKQKLSIARAFLKNAPILLLDEATSALDQSSEQSIINAIAKLRKGRTTLIITHRLSSIADANQIVVMKQGRTVEQGTHIELLNLQKEYYKLYNKELKETTNSV